MFFLCLGPVLSCFVGVARAYGSFDNFGRFLCFFGGVLGLFGVVCDDLAFGLRLEFPCVAPICSLVLSYFRLSAWGSLLWYHRGCRHGYWLLCVSLLCFIFLCVYVVFRFIFRLYFSASELLIMWFV